MNCLRAISGPALVALGGVTGCLMPPGIEPAPDAFNQPPRIIPDSLTPDPTNGPKLMSTGCSSYPFFARITDPDRADTLYWRVFVDYHRDEAPSLSPIQTLIPDPGSLVEVDLIQFSISPNDELFSTGGQPGDEPHTVELLISDRPFDSSAISPEGRVLSDDAGLTDSFIWSVHLTDDSHPCPIGEEAP